MSRLNERQSHPTQLAFKSGRQSVRREFGFAFETLSYVVGAAAIISFLESAASVGIAPLISRAIGFYREIVATIIYDPVETLVSLLGGQMTIPQWYRDCYILSLLGVGVLLRAWQHIEYVGDAISGQPVVTASSEKAPGAIFVALFSIVVSTTLIGLPLLMSYVAQAMLGAKSNDPKTNAVIQATRRSAWVIALALAAVYVLNFALP